MVNSTAATVAALDSFCSLRRAWLQQYAFGGLAVSLATGLILNASGVERGLGYAACAGRTKGLSLTRSKVMAFRPSCRTDIVLPDPLIRIRSNGTLPFRDTGYSLF
jgi:hypothetical protein